jgi:hypothetical protein
LLLSFGDAKERRGSTSMPVRHFILFFVLKQRKEAKENSRL